MIEKKIVLKCIPLDYGGSAAMTACFLKKKMHAYASDCIFTAGDFVTDIDNEKAILSLFQTLEDGSEITVSTVGADEEAAMDAVIAFLDEYCGDEGVPTAF
jgi:phosphotransferase system HPr-like phosphotransfer protein